MPHAFNFIVKFRFWTSSNYKPMEKATKLVSKSLSRSQRKRFTFCCKQLFCVLPSSSFLPPIHSFPLFRIVFNAFVSHKLPWCSLTDSFPDVPSQIPSLLPSLPFLPFLPSHICARLMILILSHIFPYFLLARCLSFAASLVCSPTSSAVIFELYQEPILNWIELIQRNQSNHHPVSSVLFTWIDRCKWFKCIWMVVTLVHFQFLSIKPTIQPSIQLPLVASIEKNIDSSFHSFTNLFISLPSSD